MEQLVKFYTSIALLENPKGPTASVPVSKCYIQSNKSLWKSKPGYVSLVSGNVQFLYPDIVIMI